MSEALPLVSPQQAAARLAGGAVYLDVRTPEEFEEGHPPGAYNVPLALRAPAGGMLDNPDFAAQVRALFAADTELLLGCKAGARAQRAGHLLRAVYTEMVVVEGGMDGSRDAFGQLTAPGWRQAGLPIDYASERSYAALSAALAR